MLGIRVARGPDWDSKDDDGGQGHLGTVIDIDLDNGCVSVVWDNGREMTYKSAEGLYELCIFSNATAGKCHEGIQCCQCKVTITGFRWLCLSCGNVNLCSQCYMANKHDTSHCFGRIDTPLSSLVKVPSRISSSTYTARGLFPGAKVLRGIHWKWQDSDGGEGTEGTVLDICDWGTSSFQGSARVQWQNKNKTVERYRIGAEGKVDLMYIKEGIGSKFYYKHLPVLDIEHCSDVSELLCGDKVEIQCISKEELHSIQKHNGWQEQMVECLDNTGTVIQTITAGLVRVQYTSGNLYTLHRFLLTKIYRLEIGDLVRMIKDKDAAFNLQQGHGGWSNSYSRALGKLGRVVHIDNDGDLLVVINKKEFMFSPVCCSLIDPNSVSTNELVPPIPKDLNVVKLFEPGELFTRKVSQLDLKVCSLTSLVKAAGKGNLSDVKDIVHKDSAKIEIEENGMTPLQIACHKGHEKIVKYLLEFKAEIDKADADCNTPLHFAVHGEKSAIVNLLLENGADHSLVNKQGQTVLHIAVQKKLGAAVNFLVKADCSFYIKDHNGSTALHDAMRGGHENIISFLLRRHNIIFHTENKDGYNVLQWAVKCKCACGVEAVLDQCKDAKLVNHRMSRSGITALHIAAMYNNRHCAQLLLTKGRADVGIKDSNDQTPLHVAVSYAHQAIVELLLEFDCEVNLKDKDGNTPLHLSQMRQKSTMTQTDKCNMEDSMTIIACILLEHGASLDIPNRNGQKVLDLVQAGPTRTFLQRIAKTAEERRKAQSGSSGISLPLHWRNMGKHTTLYVSLDQTNSVEKSEFYSVSHQLLQGLQKRQIIEVIRVQNKHLWELYAVKKKQLEARYGRGNENEVSLFHGTKSELAYKISEENFDFRIAGENVGAMYGKGAYFATDPSLSDTYCSDEEKDGLRYMLLAKVLAGRLTYGSPEMQKPPDGYDSVVDNPKNPRIYCIFDFNQLYPEYIIKYK